MTEAIEAAKAQLLKAIESRVVELMTAAIEKAKADIAEAALNSVDNPFDESELDGAIREEAGTFDWSEVLAD